MNRIRQVLNIAAVIAAALIAVILAVLYVLRCLSDDYAVPCWWAYFIVGILLVVRHKTRFRG